MTDNETTAPEDPAAPETATVHIALYGDDGEPNGKTKAILVKRPTVDQLAAFDQTAYEFRLFYEAWQGDAEFTDDERGRMFSKMINGMNVFTAREYDQDWVESALAKGRITFRSIADAVADARDKLGLPTPDESPAAGADITVS